MSIKFGMISSKCMRILFASALIDWWKEEKEEKYEKSNGFQELVSQELLGLLLSNLICKVWYTKAL